MLLASYGVTIKSIVACDPSYANQFLCLFLAGIVLEVLISLIARSVAALVHRSKRVEHNILQELIEGLKNEESSLYITDGFDTWCKKNGIEAGVIEPTFEEFLKCGDGGGGDGKGDDGVKFDSRDEAADVYLKSDSRRKVWARFAVHSQAYQLAVSIQHMFSGIAALLAVTVTDDRELFLTLARWSILLEAGYEAFDMVKKVIYPFIIHRKFDLMTFLLACHHVTLYMFLPLNRISIPGPIGYEIIVLVILCAGLVGPISILNFLKKNMDSTTPNGRMIFLATQILTSTIFVVTRGPCWIYLAFRILRSLWNDGTPWPIFLSYALAGLLFSFFNLFLIIWCRKGTQSALKKFREGAEVKETERPIMGKRPTMGRSLSIIDVLAQEVNTSKRSSLKTSIMLMGVDYELDDEEVKELDLRSSTRRLSVKNNRMKSSFFFSTRDTLKEE